MWPPLKNTHFRRCTNTHRGALAQTNASVIRSVAPLLSNNHSPLHSSLRLAITQTVKSVCQGSTRGPNSAIEAVPRPKIHRSKINSLVSCQSQLEREDTEPQPADSL